MSFQGEARSALSGSFFLAPLKRVVVATAASNSSGVFSRKLPASSELPAEPRLPIAARVPRARIFQKPASFGRGFESKGLVKNRLGIHRALGSCIVIRRPCQCEIAAPIPSRFPDFLFGLQ